MAWSAWRTQGGVGAGSRDALASALLGPPGAVLQLALPSVATPQSSYRVGQVAPQPGAEADAATLSGASAGPRGEAALDRRVNIVFSKPGACARRRDVARVGGRVDGRLVQVADLALTAKLSREESLSWVTRLHDGSSVVGATVELIGRSPKGPSAT